MVDTNSGENPSRSLPVLSDEWLEEIKNRSAEYDAGLAELVPWERVKAEAFRRLKLSSADDIA